MSKTVIKKQSVQSVEVGTLIKPEKKIREETTKEKQVIIHCAFTSSHGDIGIRIWPSTFLIAKDVSHRSELVLAENIPLAPEWLNVPGGSYLNFTLIFSGLPDECRVFDLVEEIPQPGGFFISNIERNGSDVYTINM